MRVGPTISGLMFASTLVVSSTAVQAATFDIDFMISSNYFVTDGQISNVSVSDFPAKGSATITSVGSGYEISDFSLHAGRYSFPADFFSNVVAVYQNGATLSGFVLSSYAVGYERTLTFDFARGHLGDFALVQAEPDYVSFGCSGCVSASLAAADLPSTVPLPSSAPLFGVALVGLAAMGLRGRPRKASLPT
ncbi:hypothetical protein P7D22_12865 [Lichenihabitans sp. Uapishka_5]|uniref:hypothetical protein n=1 Tax=Lichenihabitans sp. Uapishka_5 TaxID=3037302 RepID=UPI0029E7DAE7|nr:hypothetical protein [Lichenihabitans sp. Uapishka_5]MDX7952064.1 hypothetical protein [Lichenihabitans sp. Uapishka_5]